MALLETIDADIIKSMKAGDKPKLEILRMVKSALKNEKIAKGSDLNDDDAVSVIKRQLKQTKEALVDFEKGGRDDLAQKARAETETLERYLPRELEDEQILRVIEQKVELAGGKNAGEAQMGKLMGAVMQELRGKASGDRVRILVEKFIKG